MLWFEETADDDVLLREGTVGTRPRTVQRFVPHGGEPGRQYLDPALAASSSRVLVSAQGYDPGSRLVARRWLSVDLFTGPPSGPLEHFSRCPGDPSRLRSVDVSGDAYVYRQCDDRFGHVEVRDGGEPPLSPPRTAGEGGYGARLAGRFVAWLDGYYSEQVTYNAADIVVYDRVLGSQVYRVPRSRMPGLVHSLDVQDDGKIAFAFDSDPRDSRPQVRVAWASPQEPYLHVLPLAAMSTYDVKIANDTIAFQRGRNHNFVVPRAEVGLSDLEGDARILGRRSDDYLFRESFDYDGRRLVWIELGCERRRIVVHDGNARRPQDRRRRCPLEVRSRPVVRGDVVQLKLGCGALRKPCGFAIGLYTTGPRRRLAGEGGGDWNAVRVTLTPAGRRIIAGGGSVRLDVRALMSDADTRTERRRATIVVRR